MLHFFDADLRFEGEMIESLAALGPPLFKAVSGYMSKQADLRESAEARRFEARQQTRALVAQGILQGAAIAAPLALQAWQERRQAQVAQWVAEDGLGLAPPSAGRMPGGQQTRSAVRPANYPIDGDPGSLMEDLDLLGPHARNTPLILLVPAPAPAADERWGAGLLRRVYSDLVGYQGSGNLIVRTADRAFQWPNAIFHREDLGDRPTIALQMTADRERLDIQVAGCHLGPRPGCPPFPQRHAFALRLPRLDDWDQRKVREINETAGQGHFGLPLPADPEALADINHELAARVGALCAIAALDCHHIMATPAYDEMLDEAVARAGVIADDWPADDMLPLGFAADPAYHALHCCARLLRRGEAGSAERQVLLALALLAGEESAAARQPSPTADILAALLDRARAAGLMHDKHRTKLQTLLPAFGLLDAAFEPTSDSGLAESAAVPEPGPAAARRPARLARSLASQSQWLPGQGAGSSPVAFNPAEVKLSIIQAPRWVASIAFSPDGARLAVGCLMRVAVIVDLAGREQLRLNLGVGVAPVTDVAFSPDGRWLATSTTDNRAQVWDSVNGGQASRFRGGNRVNGVAFSPDGVLLATCGDDYRARIWDISSGKQLHEVLHAGEVGDVAFSPDGQFLATASTDNTSRVWNVVTGEQTFKIRQTGNFVSFSPDGQFLATYSGEIVQISAIANDNQVIEIHTGPVTPPPGVSAGGNLAFSQDWRLLAACVGKNVGVWDVGTGNQLLRFTHAQTMYNVAFSPDGQILVTSGESSNLWLRRLIRIDDV